MIPTLFFQLDNWANDLVMFFFGTYFVIVETIGIMVGLWIIGELGFFIYKRLHYRYQSVVLGMNV